MSHERKPESNGKRGLGVAQSVAAIALAALTVGSTIFVAGGVFSRIRFTETVIERNTGRLTVLEEWRRAVDRFDVENVAYHKRCEELIRELQKDVDDLRLRVDEMNRRMKP